MPKLKCPKCGYPKDEFMARGEFLGVMRGTILWDTDSGEFEELTPQIDTECIDCPRCDRQFSLDQLISAGREPDIDTKEEL